jgi:hypothetical protein
VQTILRIDWFQVIAQLEAQGITLRTQAGACGVAPGTIYYWKTGGEPRYNTGAKLLDLYGECISSGYPTLTLPST